MAMPELIFDNENHFVDITSEDVRIRFSDTEEIEGHTFKHVEYGIFAADPAFVIHNADMYDMVVKYRDIVFVVECENESKEDDECVYKVIFAYSKEISDQYDKLNYLNIHGKKNAKFKEVYDFSRRLNPVEYGFYTTFKLHGASLPENNSALVPLYHKFVLPSGRIPWIQLNMHIGIEVEEGIYYFADGGFSLEYESDSLPIVNLNTVFDAQVAAICHSIDIHLSSEAAVEYIAIGKEHFSRLQEIQRILNTGFYHEYKVDKGQFHEEKETKEKSVVLTMDNINELLGGFKKKDSAQSDKIPDEAEELMKGFGFVDICVRFERPFFEPSKFRKYDIAYKLGNNLVLGTRKGSDGEMVLEYHDLRFLSALYVKKMTRLKSGIVYPVIHKVIECREERLKQLLTPEAYSLYINECD